MMKLSFKKGAIVRFGLTCSNANLTACGKIVKVTADEVVFLPQEYVSETEYETNWGTTKLDRYRSVDRCPEIHLDRSIIGMWWYEPVPCGGRTTYYGVWQPSEIANTEVNQYDEDGFCRGEGDFFE